MVAPQGALSEDLLDGALMVVPSRAAVGEGLGEGSIMEKVKGGKGVLVGLDLPRAVE